MGCSSSKATPVSEHSPKASVQSTPHKGAAQRAAKAQPGSSGRDVPDNAAAAAPVEQPTCGGVELPTCGGVKAGAPAAPQINAPWDEEERLKSLRELGVIDTIPEPRFDTIVSLMKSIFQVEVALVSLVDFEALTFHARAGEWACKGGRAGAFCDWIFVPRAPTMLIIEDALEDARFISNKFVTGPPGIRFYAGAPLVSTDGGHRYGTLCVIDYKPRRFTADQYAMLAHFAEVVTRELERDKVLKWQSQALQAATLKHMQMLRTLDCFTEGVMLCDPSSPGWRILYVNDAWVAATGVGRDTALSSKGFWELFEGQDRAKGAAPQGSNSQQEKDEVVGDEAAAAAAAAQSRAFTARVAPHAGGGGGAPSLAFAFKPSGAAYHLRDDCPHIGIPNFVGMRPEEGAGEPQGQSPGATEGPHYYFGTIQWQGWLGVGDTPRSSLLSDGETEGRSSGFSGLNSTAAAKEQPIASGDSAVMSEGSAVGRSESLKGFLQQQQVPHFRKIRPKIMHEVKLGPLIGAGSHGRCYRGLWHGTPVCVKIMECWEDAPVRVVAGQPEGELQTDAVVEGLISKSLSHPHIVACYDYAVSAQELGQGPAAGKVYQQVWILQSYCSRGTLFDAIDRGLLRDRSGQPTAVAILQTASEIASAMGYLHDKGVLHGDLTPSNVLISDSPKDARRWIAQVGDFGLAKRTDGSGKEIITDTFGTVTHMPPELLLHGTLTAASDVFSFGVILWEMWTGTRAWLGLSPAQIMHSVSTGSKTLEPPGDAPKWYQDTIWRCLSRQRSERPTFKDLQQMFSSEIKRAPVSSRSGTQGSGGRGTGGEPAPMGLISNFDVRRRVSLETSRTASVESPLTSTPKQHGMQTLHEDLAG